MVEDNKLYKYVRNFKGPYIGIAGHFEFLKDPSQDQ